LQRLQSYPAHLKINTGMNRLGFSIADLDRLIIFLQQNPMVQVVGVGTHLMASEDLFDEVGSAADQLKKFHQVLLRLNFNTCSLHAYNTSGALYAQKKVFSTQKAPYGLRVGMGLYGYATIPLDDLCVLSLK